MNDTKRSAALVAILLALVGVSALALQKDKAADVGEGTASERVADPASARQAAVKQYVRALEAGIASRSEAEADIAMTKINRAIECIRNTGAERERPSVSMVADTPEKQAAFERFNAWTAEKTYTIPVSDQGASACDFKIESD